jgi:hypothetical protein
MPYKNKADAKRYYETHKEEINLKRRSDRQANLEEYREKDKERYAQRKDTTSYKSHKANYYQEHKEDKKNYNARIS